MKPLRFLAQAILLAAALVTMQAQVTNTNTTPIIGQWDFNSANLDAATVGSPLQFIGFTPTFVERELNGRLAGVMSLPTTAPEQRILATFAPTNNGGGTNLNQYTIVMDVMWPAESEGTWRSVFNADTSNANDGEIFVDPDGRIGIFNNYAGQMHPNIWYRLGLVFDLSTNEMTRYLNGTNVLGTNATVLPLPEGARDGQFSLNGGVLFFSDNDGETAPALVNVIQLRAGAMTAEQMAALGGPGTNGLGEGGAPVGDVAIEGITRNGNSVTITVNNEGRTIQLQTTSNIANPLSWVNLGAPSTLSTFTVPISGNMTFFRVQVL
jgi:hypothetical protein